MIFTEEFIYIEEPRTGSTFVQEMIRQAHLKRSTRLNRLGRLLARRHITGFILYKPAENSGGGRHGTCRDIPIRLRERILHNRRWKEDHRPIVATIRDPYSRLASDYRLFLATKGGVDFDTFLRRHYTEGMLGMPPERVGYETMCFFHWFSLDPAWSSRNITKKKVEAGFDGFKDELYPIEFLNVNCVVGGVETDLNRKLHSLMLERGWKHRHIQHIISAPHLGTNMSPTLEWRSLYTDELLEFVTAHEEPLLAMFPQWRLC